MSNQYLCKLLDLNINTDPSQVNDLDYSWVISAGILDFNDIKVGVDDIASLRIKYIAPSRLVKQVLKRCKKGGMSNIQFDIAYSSITSVKNKSLKSFADQLNDAFETYCEITRFKTIENTQQSSKSDINWYYKNYDKYSKYQFKYQNWSRFYLNNQQMEISTLRCFIFLAKKLEWLDCRDHPTVPDPSRYSWGTQSIGQSSHTRRWHHFWRSSDAQGFIQRIDVIESIIQLLTKKNSDEINFSSIYECFMLETPFRNKFRPFLGMASVSQILRRFHEGAFSSPEYPNDDFYNMVNFICTVNDRDWIGEKKDIAKFKRGGEKIDKRKFRLKDNASGKFKKT